jgi:hypothetical protein
MVLSFIGCYDWGWSGAAVATGGTAGVGGDFGNKPIPKSNNADNPMNNNSYLNLLKALLFNTIFASCFLKQFE